MTATPSGADDPLELSASVVVPDDASALEADRLALLAELQQKSVTRTTPAEPAVFKLWPVLLVFSATLIALVGFVIVFLPSGHQVPTAVPLAAAPASIQSGSAGALMPLGTVRVGLFDRTLRDFRPGVVAVVPAGSCTTCAATIASIWEQLSAFDLPLLIVGQPNDATTLRDLSAAAGGTFTAVDNHALLPPASTSIRLYAVHSDGIIEAVTGAKPGTQLEPILRNLGDPGLAASTSK